MYGVGFQSDSRNLSWKVWEIFVVVAEGDLGLCVDLCGCCRLRPLCVGQTGKGGWVCGRKAGGKEERRREPSRALPWVAPFLLWVSFLNTFFPPVLFLADNHQPQTRGHSLSRAALAPVDPGDPLITRRSPGELSGGEGGASSRESAAQITSSRHAAGDLSSRAGLLDRDRRGGRRKWNVVHVGLCSRGGCWGRHHFVLHTIYFYFFRWLLGEAWLTRSPSSSPTLPRWCTAHTERIW